MGFCVFGNGCHGGAGLPGLRRLLLSASVAVVAMGVAMGAAGPGFAQEAISYAIPAGPLDNAIARFGAASGLQVLYTSAVTAGLQSPGVSGTLPPEEALAQLLAGSGLSYRFNGPNSVTLIGADAQAGAADAPAEGGTVLDTIVVTGGKLAVDQQRNPVSTSVMTGEQIARDRVTDIRSAVSMMPNVGSSPSNNNNNGITIRGINSEGLGEVSGNQAPLASLVIDGAVQSFEGMRKGIRGTWDVEQLEVLRGPQLAYGRNAMVGAVIVETKDPTPYYEGALKLGLGSGPSNEQAFMLSGPITDELSFRIAGERMFEEKGITYVHPGGQPADDPYDYDTLQEGEYWNVRGKLRWEPSALPGSYLQYTFSRAHDNPAHTAASGPDYFARRFVFGSGVNTADGIEVRINDVASHVLEGTYEFENGWKLQSTTAFTDTRTQFDAPHPSARRDETRHDADLTQDTRLTFGDEESTFSGMVGVFLGRFDNDRDSLATRDLVFAPGFPPFTITIQDLESRLERRNLGVYSELNWRATDRLTVFGGLRYEYEKHDYHFHDRSTGVTFDGDTDFSKLLPKIGVKYQFTDDLMLALSATQGYRAGFVERSTMTNEIRRVAPESLWAYEAAVRSEWLDGRLRVNGNLFYYDWTDMQLFMPSGGAPGMGDTINANEAEAYGAELTVAIQPVDTLDVQASIGWLHTKITKIGDPLRAEIVGNRFPEAPEWTAAIGVNWRFAENWFVGGDIRYKDNFYGTGQLYNGDAYRIPAHTVANLRLGYETDNWKLTGEIRNLFDKKYLTGAGLFNDFYLGDRRTALLTLEARF